MENENAILTGEVVSPQSVTEMSDEEFDAYIETAKEGGEVQATDENTGEAVPAEAGEDEAYISFRTKEELQEYQDKTIGNRLREIRESAERDRQGMRRLEELAGVRFGTDNAAEAIEKLSRELELQNSRDFGLTPQDYADMRNIKAIRDGISYNRRVEEISNEWRRQGDALKNIVPDFDLEKAFENAEFYNLVVNGRKTLAEAYPVLNKKPQRKAITEVGNLTNGVWGHINRDVNSMSDSEFADYIKRCKL